MNLKTEQTTIKLRGGYYTPSEVSENLVDWVTADLANGATILEPSAGDGSMLKALKHKEFEFSAKAIELDPFEAEKSLILVEDDSRFSVLNTDFFNFYEDNQDKFDAIVGNPPYIRYQFLTAEQRDIQADILGRNGMKANKLINAWVAFAVASIEMLKDGGKIAFVLPTDILQVSYAQQLRHFLHEQLSEMTIVTFEVGVFEGIQQDVILLQGVKRTPQDTNHNLRIVNLLDSSQLKLVYPDRFSKVSQNDDKKWTKYLLAAEDVEMINKIYSSNKFQSLVEVAKVEVGITTGKNELFTVTQEVVDAYELQDYSLPLLGRSINSAGIKYSQLDLEDNIENGKKAWLLDFNTSNWHKFSASVKKYLSEIEEAGLNTGYKLSIREYWYNVPSIWVPDAFMLRRIGELPKLIFNEINAVSTDTFHRVKFFPNSDFYWIIFSSYSSIGLLSYELAGRNFGGGALEILPGDIQEIILPKKIESIINSRDLFIHLDQLFRMKKTAQEIMDYVDDVLIEHNILSAYESERYKEIWKKLNSRRMNK